MATVKASAAVSHVGRVRSNNQDSGYAGRNLFLVADGMGGHAGGDVASAIATRRISEADGDYASAPDAAAALEGALIAANRQLAETVAEHSELTGMGTTVSAVLLDGDRVVISHIGDSRIYLLRSGELSQISTDHTFVQRLVDAGRITAEEAMVHPRRSVLMRVLGDVESSPEIDSMVLDTRDGDRWMLCSDGLSGVVSFDELHELLSADAGAKQVADRLVKASLDGGAPDNVTVVVIDIGEPAAPATPPLVVGSAAAPLAFGAAEPVRARGIRLAPFRPHPVQETHFEPDSADYFDELIEEDARRRRRRRFVWSFWIVLLVGGDRRRVRARLPVDADALLRGRVQRPGGDLPGHPAGPRPDLAARAAHRDHHRRGRPAHVRPAAGGADDQRRLVLGGPPNRAATGGLR